MEHNKISELLNDSTVPVFVTRKQTEVNDSSRGQYSIKKNIRFKTPMLRQDLCDFSDAHIVVKREISVKNFAHDNRRNKKLTFKNNTPFKSCI